MRLIDADALIKWIDDSVSQYGHIYSTDMLNMWGLFKDYLINNAPTVEPEPYFEKAEKDKRIYERGFEDGQNARPQCEAECMEEDAKQASIPYTYSSPQHDWKCGYPDSTGG